MPICLIHSQSYTDFCVYCGPPHKVTISTDTVWEQSPAPTHKPEKHRTPRKKRERKS